MLRATDILLNNGILPRWQAFIYKTNKDEIVELLRLSEELSLKSRCEKTGGDFVFFVHTGSCDGENAKLYGDRIRKNNIPAQLIPYFSGYEKLLSEKDICEKYKGSNARFIPHNDDKVTLNITGDLSVYFNFTHIKPEWKIGNINTDDREFLIRKVVDEDTLPLNLARKITVGEMIEKFGDFSSERVFEVEDYFQYLLNLCAKNIIRA